MYRARFFMAVLAACTVVAIAAPAAEAAVAPGPGQSGLHPAGVWSDAPGVPGALGPVSGLKRLPVSDDPIRLAQIVIGGGGGGGFGIRLGGGRERGHRRYGRERERYGRGGREFRRFRERRRGRDQGFRGRSPRHADEGRRYRDRGGRFERLRERSNRRVERERRFRDRREGLRERVRDRRRDRARDGEWRRAQERMRKLKDRREAMRERLRDRKREAMRDRLRERKRDMILERNRQVQRERLRAARMLRERKLRRLEESRERLRRARADAARRQKAVLERRRERMRAETRRRVLRERVRKVRETRNERYAKLKNKLEQRQKLRKRLRRMRLSVLKRRWWRKNCGPSGGRGGDYTAGGTHGSSAYRRPPRGGKKWRCGPSLPEIVGIGVGIGIIGGITAPPSYGGADEGPRAPEGRPPEETAPPEPPARVVAPPPPPVRQAAVPPSQPPRRPPARRSQSPITPPVPPVPAPVVDDRFWPGQVVVQIDRFAPPALDAQLAQAFNLQVVSSEVNELLGARIVLFRIPDQREVAAVSSALTADPRVGRAQPNWRYAMVKDGKRASDEVDETLYSVTKIGLSAAHAVASGLGVKVAVIDSGVDERHSELRGSVLKAFDATRGRGQKDETHGTAIAGIIRAKDGRARGVAPGAELLSATAFFKETGQAGAFSSTMILLRALNWSVLSGARIINMSFAGPQDAKLADAVTAAAGRGVILVAAAGNNGPRAEPAYPAAYTNVIAVTATDVDDELYENANRGSYVAVAAPGVDVLVLKPAAGHAFSSGTSMAAAHVSGLIALMLERNGKLGFEDVRAALTRTARDLGERGIDTKFGAGRVDAAALIQSVPLPEGPAVSLAKQDR